MTRRATRRKDAARATGPEYLTTAEVAGLLRLNQKKVYALLADGRLPAARVSGKWLFPRELIARWVAEHTVYPPTGVMGALLDKLLVIQGSDDWLLGTALDAVRSRESLPIATAAVGSVAGLRALAAGAAHVAGFHLSEEDAVRLVPAGDTWYVIDLAEREQGFILAPALYAAVRDPVQAARRRLRLAARQPDSGTFHLTQRLFKEAGADSGRLRQVGPYGTHIEVALAVRAGLADFGVGVRVAAEMAGLSFRPLHREVFRLAIPAAYFGHGCMGRFLQALLSEFEAARGRGLPGYSFGPLGKTRPMRGPE
ncbi:MAG: helix-turn-helix transcriptional regulator [Deltaproteobacteria bacterium]|nr:helix-turn-helix transcriptional regulator [Deltaproteobacteria bacterium]